MFDQGKERRQETALAGRIATIAGAAALLLAAIPPGTALAGPGDGPTFRLAVGECSSTVAVRSAVRRFLRDAGYAGPRSVARAGAYVGTPSMTAGACKVPVRFYRGRLPAARGAFYIDCNARDVSVSMSIANLAGLPPATAATAARFAGRGK